MDLIGQQIQNFTFRRILASGGYGTVYIAYDHSVNREVAIKTILPDHARQDEFKQRFETEAKIVAQLEHPHIVPLFHFWQDEKGAFLVMRYIRGGNLRDLMNKNGQLSLTQTARILTQIAGALDVAHTQSVIHRDLKPENILLDDQGNAYLSDFGIAKQIHEPQNLTNSDSIVGTWHYLSPEQIENRAISPQTDIYSLGIMLYEMLAAQHPYGEAHLTLMLLKHLQETLPNITVIRPDIGLEVNGVIQRATLKTPELRYEKVSAFSNAFHNAVSGIPPSLSVASTKHMITKPIEKTQLLMPVSPEGRNRFAMLQNVRKFWIEGVLETSLHNVEMLDLPVANMPDSVSHPWQNLLNITGNDDNEPLSSRQISQYFDNLNGKMLIMGAPGAGKTTTLLLLTRELLHRASVDPQHAIPIVLNLASWSQEADTLVEWLEDELHVKYQTPRRIAREWIREDKLALMLDGLDEVAPNRRNNCIKAINQYREEHGFVDVVLCTRTQEYQAMLQQAMLNGAIRIDPLTDQQISDYFATLGETGTRIQGLIAGDETLQELSRIPLMLRILVQTYRNLPTAEIPKSDNPTDQRRHLFDLYFTEMISRRVQQTAYDAATIRAYLTWLAKQMQEQSVSIFQIENLQPAWLEQADQMRYRQAFLAINVLSQMAFWGLPRQLHTAEIVGRSNLAKTLIWSTSGGIWGAVIGSGRWRNWIFPVLAGVMFALGIVFDTYTPIVMETIIDWLSPLMIYAGILYIMSVLMKRIGFQLDTIITVELLRFSRFHVRLLYGFIGSLTGIATPFVNSAAFNGETATSQEMLTGILLGAVIGAAAGLFLSGFISAPSGNASRPNQGMWRTLRNAIQMSLLIASIFFFNIMVTTIPVSTLSFGISQGLISALAFGFNGFILFGGYAIIQHVIVRFLLARRGHIPFNLADFLDTAASLLLLRKVGSGYIFIHRYLLEYFAESKQVD